MEKEKQLPPEGVSEQKLAYLKMQAGVGITKHMGGPKATEELIKLCHIDKGKYVLDVGCGTGRTACLLAKKYGCRVVGIDITPGMVKWSKEIAKEEGVEDKVEFKVAGAQKPGVQEIPEDDKNPPLKTCTIITDMVYTLEGNKRNGLLALKTLRVLPFGSYNTGYTAHLRRDSARSVYADFV